MTPRRTGIPCHAGRPPLPENVLRAGKRQKIAACALVLLLSSAQIATAQTPQVGKYETLELVFTADSTPANPFDTYLLKLELTDPSGTTFTIDGFYDGDGNGGQNGTVWKARICPYATGRWSWRTVPGEAVDAGLAALTGQFDVVANGNLGGVVVDAQHFRFQEGPNVFLYGNFLDFTFSLPERTTHVHMGDDVTDAQRNTQMTQHRDVWAANKANVYFANKGDYQGWSVTPWVGTANNNDKTKMDLARWRDYDQQIREFAENSILAQMWFLADDSSFGSLSVSHKNRLFRYGMARTSAFTHTMYVIALEWGEGWTTTEVNAAGNYIEQHNPWGRLLSVHNHEDWAFSGQPWATFIATQDGNNASPSSVNSLAIAMRQNETIPHIDEEFYNGPQDGSDLRGLRNVWANFLGGAAGSGSGSGLKGLGEFLAQSRVPFQRMAADNETVEDGGDTRFALAEPGQHYVMYSRSGSFSITVTGNGLEGHWFNPRDSQATLGSPFPVSAGTTIQTPPSETGSDWVLWITSGTNLNTGTTHPSPGLVVVQQIVNAGGNDPPVVAIDSPAAGSSFVIGGTVNINATASDPDGTVVRVAFFVDGEEVGADTSAPFGFAWSTAVATSGSHGLTAEAEDDDGAVTVSTSVQISLQAGQNPPSIDAFVATPATVLQGGNVNYSFTATDLDNGQLSYSIDVDNDGTAEQAGSFASGDTISYDHSFSSPGVNTAWVTVTDSSSLSVSATAVVTVVEPLNNASTGANNTTGTAPLSVIFSGSATGGIPPFTYVWDFGDGTGNPGPGNDVSHVYDTPGTFNASVTVIDSIATSVTGQTVIVVAPGIPPSPPTQFEVQ